MVEWMLEHWVLTLIYIIAYSLSAYVLYGELIMDHTSYEAINMGYAGPAKWWEYVLTFMPVNVVLVVLVILFFVVVLPITDYFEKKRNAKRRQKRYQFKK